MTLAWRAETRVGKDDTNRPPRPAYVPLCVPDKLTTYAILPSHGRHYATKALVPRRDGRNES
jgi:hypothetical protein